MPAGLVIEVHFSFSDGEKSPAQSASRTHAGERLVHFVSDNLNSIGKTQINIVASDNSTLAYLSGRIDIDSSPALRDQFLALLQSPCPKLLCVDLSGVTHFDSSGIATLIEALKIARTKKTRLRLQGLQGGLLQLFESTRILSLFDDSVLNASQCEAQ
jgi:anti-sigma B factor antagonist